MKIREACWHLQLAYDLVHHQVICPTEMRLRPDLPWRIMQTFSVPTNFREYCEHSCTSEDKISSQGRGINFPAAENLGQVWLERSWLSIRKFKCSRQDDMCRDIRYILGQNLEEGITEGASELSGSWKVV